MFRRTALLALLLLAGCLGPDESGPPAPEGFVAFPPGSFRMGEPDPFDPYLGTRRVTLTRGFLLAEDELTLDRFLTALNHAAAGDLVFADEGRVWDSETGLPLAALFPDFPAEIEYLPATGRYQLAPGASPFLPVRWISWHGAAACCDWLNAMDGHAPSYEKGPWDWPCGPLGNPYEAEGWRLPTEAEWEYAARFDDGRRYPWGDYAPDCTLANGPRGPGEPPCWDRPLEVGSLSPWGDSWMGLRDLSGNLAEWCQDWHGDWEDYDPLFDPVDVDAEDMFDKVCRGGSYDGPFEDLSLWARRATWPDEGNPRTGFRLARRWD